MNVQKILKRKQTALIYCENQFGLMDGKTAAGLVRHSETYTIVGIIDSSLAGKDAGEQLGNEKNYIPIFANLQSALDKLPNVPNCYIRLLAFIQGTGNREQGTGNRKKN
jgi:uncharacterized NAD-dependent epimerase/dehydratase family protein